MKKAISLVVYILYTLLGGTCALLIYIGLSNGAYQGWDAIGGAILLAFSIAFAIAGLVPLVLKLIHIGTDWGFFGFLCILVDIAFIAISVYYPISIKDMTAFILTGPVAILSAVSLIANIASLKD